LKVTTPVGAVPVTLAVSRTGTPTCTVVAAVLRVVVVVTVGAAKTDAAGIASKTMHNQLPSFLRGLFILIIAPPR
jgi:hypothetical protein